MAQLSYWYMTTRKTIALITQTFVGKMMPLFFNTLSRFVIAFLQKGGIPYISDIIWYFSFSVWLTSLSMIISRFIHVAANGIISYIFIPTFIFEVFQTDRKVEKLIQSTLEYPSPTFPFLLSPSSYEICMYWYASTRVPGLPSWC